MHGTTQLVHILLTIVCDLDTGMEAWLLRHQVACLQEEMFIAVLVVGQSMTKRVQGRDLKIAMRAAWPRPHVHLRHLHLHTLAGFTSTAKFSDPNFSKSNK